MDGGPTNLTRKIRLGVVKDDRKIGLPARRRKNRLLMHQRKNQLLARWRKNRLLVRNDDSGLRQADGR
uniref:Uncharacterized protein n=1 Tax=Cucumis melo TaxID=3656 RepID=A0A9I9CKG5_CUCME